MDCKRYKESLSEAAAGAHESQREAALRAHLETCAPCRAALGAERELYAAIDRGVATSVAALPSTEFAARVRQRLAAEPLPARPWFGGLRFAGWAPAAALAMAVLVLGIAWLGRRAPAPGAAIESARNALSQVPAQVQSQTEERNSAWAANSTVALAPGAISPQPGAETSGSRGVELFRPSTRTQVREPEVLVPPGEQAAVLQLYEALRKRRVAAEFLVAPLPAALEPVPLTIAPLEIARLEIASIPSGAQVER